MQEVNLKRYYTIDYWRLFWNIFFILQRRIELQSLITWSRKKHLPKVETAYIERLGDEERRLFRMSLHFPLLTTIAKALLTLSRVIVPQTRYYKGYSTKCSKRFLTTESKKTYSDITT
jgi:hypothetical protein